MTYNRGTPNRGTPTQRKVCPTCGQVIGSGKKPPGIDVKPIPGYPDFPGRQPTPPDRKFPTPEEDRRMKPPGFPDRRFPELPDRRFPELPAEHFPKPFPNEQAAQQSGATGIQPNYQYKTPESGMNRRAGLAKKTYPLPYPKNYRR